jgi:hypothetical protein
MGENENSGQKENGCSDEMRTNDATLSDEQLSARSQREEDLCQARHSKGI